MFETVGFTTCDLIITQAVRIIVTTSPVLAEAMCMKDATY